MAQGVDIQYTYAMIPIYIILSCVVVGFIILNIMFWKDGNRTDDDKKIYTFIVVAFIVIMGLALPITVWPAVEYHRSHTIPVLPIMVPVVIATALLALGCCGFAVAMCADSRRAAFPGLWRVRWGGAGRPRGPAAPPPAGGAPPPPRGPPSSFFLVCSRACSVSRGGV